MKNKFNRFLCFVLILGIFSFCGTFISCENLFGAKEKAIQEKAYITITTNLSSNVRTVFPSKFTEDTTGLTWTLTGIPSGGEEQKLGEWKDTEESTTIAYNNMISDTSITLNAGTWTFTLTAKNNSGKVLEATITKTITGGKNTLSFVMKEAVGEEAASGQIEFTLQWKELGVVGNVAITLSKRNDSNFSDIISDLSPLKSDDNKYEYVFYSAGADSTLTPGNYILKLKLQQQTGTTEATENPSAEPKTINTYTCLIHVAPGLCSEGKAELDTLAPLYTINYLEEDGKTVINSFEENSVPTTYNEYTTFALPTPTKVGHIFSGWYKRNENNTFVKIENTDNFRISSNTNLYAKWNLIETWEDITRAVNCVPSTSLPSQPEFIVTNNLTATRTITISGGITLKALDGTNGVTITRGLDNSGTAFKGAFFDNRATLTLEGITLDGGKDSIEASAPLITSSVSLTLNNCTLQNNKNTSNTPGGAIYISGGTFTMNGGVIGKVITENDLSKTYSWQYAADANNYSNYAEAGGGGIYVADGTVTIKDGAKISYNYTPNPDENLDGENKKNLKISHGGGISVVKGNLTINNAEVSYNSGYQGAGIRCYGASSAGTLTLNGATIKGNASRTQRYSNYGGGLMVNNFTVKFEGDTPSVIEENYSGDGGALFLENTDSTLQNITIQNNSYNEDGYKNGSEVLLYSGATVSIGSRDVKIISAGGETRGIFMNYDEKKPNTLNLFGDAKLDAPIYLTNGAMVTVSKELTSTDTVATITPEQYTVGTQVVNASEGVDIVGKFAVTSESNEDGTTTTYTIDSAGYLAKASSGDTEGGTEGEKIEADKTVSDWATLKSTIESITGTTYTEENPYVIEITGNMNTEDSTVEVITVSSHVKLVSNSDCTITRTSAFASVNLFQVNSVASLTIGDENAGGTLTLDGGGTDVSATASLIKVSGTLVLNEKSVLQNNNCQEAYGTSGSAVYSNGGTIKVSGATINNNSNNYSNSYGGAIYIKNGTLNITSGLFENNSTYKNGGAIYVTEGTVNITGGEFTNNIVSSGSNKTETGYGGSAIYIDRATTSISSVEFKNNITYDGVGTLLVTNIGDENTPATITNCTFTNNTAYQKGAAIYTGGASYIEINNCTFTENTVTNTDSTTGTGPGEQSDVYIGNISGTTKINEEVVTEAWNSSSAGTGRGDSEGITINNVVIENTSLVNVLNENIVITNKESSGAFSLENVSLSPYAIGKYEVTQKLYQTVIGTNPSSSNTGDNYPVENINYYEALVFCNELTKLTFGEAQCYYIISNIQYNNDGKISSATVEVNTANKGYRLPTEAEWEFAARGGDPTNTTNWNYTYAGSDDVDEVAWYYENSSEKSHLVGAKSSNSLGLYDMSGNVNEYCYDSTSSKAIFKGGSWFDADYGDDISPFLCKIYFNDIIVKSNTANYIGFRLCRSIIE